MDMNHLAVDINSWANEAFPERTDNSMFLKMYGEIAEMIEADDDHVGGELADIFIMLLDYTKRKGLNPSIIVQEKMRINRARAWEKNKLGAYSHVKDTPRIPGTSGVGDHNEGLGGETLAHGRDAKRAASCRAHGQCLATGLDDCSNFPEIPLRARECFAQCDGPRSGRGIYGRHPDALKAINWERSDSNGRTVSVTAIIPGPKGGEGHQ